MNTNNDFRSLNENEVHCESKTLKSRLRVVYRSDLDGVSVQYSKMQGGFTIAVVKHETPSCLYLYIGASRRSYKDKPNHIKGEILAFKRAIQSIPISLPKEDRFK